MLHRTSPVFLLIKLLIYAPKKLQVDSFAELAVGSDFLLSMASVCMNAALQVLLLLAQQLSC
jgi:hypothetical protein